MIAYIDIVSGISGDMFLASLIDAGFPLKKLREEVDKLGIEVNIEAKKVKDVVEGTSLKIYSSDKKFRNLKDISKIIDESEIDKDIKEKAKKIFKEIAKVEAKIHGIAIEKVHFHELGAVDTIVDIVGTLIALKYLKIEKLYSSPPILGRGKVKCEHGIIPLPAPATLELLKGKPVIFSSLEGETTTPTGAALLGLAEFAFPEIEVKKIGYGMGAKKLAIPNFLRIVIGKEVDEEGIYMIETNIDNMNPEFFPYLIEKIIKSGAKDAFILPAIMKKGRIGGLLKVLATDDKIEEIKKIIFEETTTLGIRYYKVKRDILEREIRKIETKYGEVNVKIGYYNGKIVSISPEYEDCRKIAEKRKIPLKEIYEEAKRIALWEQF
ncbi:MAG: nickel pincer cofactor biosynthesis protein LarC [Candidatus Thermoplasmatota archaeon]